MTRKRFVKLAMSLGNSRNEAERMAAVVRKRRISYGDYFPYLENGVKERAAFRALDKALLMASSSAMEAASAISRLAGIARTIK